MIAQAPRAEGKPVLHTKLYHTVLTILRRLGVTTSPMKIVPQQTVLTRTECKTYSVFDISNAKGSPGVPPMDYWFTLTLISKGT